MGSWSPYVRLNMPHETQDSSPTAGHLAKPVVQDVAVPRGTPEEAAAAVEAGGDSTQMHEHPEHGFQVSALTAAAERNKPAMAETLLQCRSTG